ncbi:unnamed protein product [Adineta steineri]|uniref:Uncharacterized protein n=1 Tax=Adineta steineri TaxID=433720 RepID=A0A814UQ79_9BILA|nr:unnamed protein product [Adineta steineri]
MDLNELTALLSNTPCLRHLSAMLWHRTNFELKSPCNIMTDLTYMSLRLCSNIPFDNLQKFFINHCPFVEVLHISTYERNINANEWKQLMSLSLPNLRVFNIQFLVYFTNQPPQKNDIEQKIKLFNSSFWTERQWLFEYEISMTIDNFKIIIYSTKSFGRTKYKICDESHGLIDINHLKSVDHIKISSKKAINQYMYHFPYATKLTLGHTLSITSSAMIINEIIGILRLKQIEVLAIEYAYLCPVIMCELLDFMPNIHTLTFHSMSFRENNTLSIEQNDIFRSISKKHLIKNVTFREYCTLYKLKLILKLFPRLQCIRLDSKLEHIQSILEYLSDKNHLILVCFFRASRCYIGRINKLIKAGSLSYNFKTAYDDRNRTAYVWW